MEPLVEIKNLSIRFPEGNSTFEAVKGISFSIGKGEIVGVVGESGSGKSMSALALMGLLPKDAEIASGSLCFHISFINRSNSICIRSSSLSFNDR